MGPTAVGKTSLAIALAQKAGSDVVSADSRQVYRGLDIGSGKDVKEYADAGVKAHLIDIVSPEIEYTLADYQEDFWQTHHELEAEGKDYVWCGGTGLYFLAILKQYADTQIPTNHELRQQLELKEKEELLTIYQTLPKQAHDDLGSKRRLIRAIEKGIYLKENPIAPKIENKLDYQAFCISEERDLVVRNIDHRLQARFKEGMVEEVEGLLKDGLSPERLIRLGLEYKFITQFLKGQFSRVEMEEKLKVAIHQFSKRQMTFFRKIEKEGILIQWVSKQEFAKRFGI